MTAYRFKSSDLGAQFLTQSFYGRNCFFSFKDVWNTSKKDPLAVNCHTLLGFVVRAISQTVLISVNARYETPKP